MWQHGTRLITWRLKTAFFLQVQPSHCGKPAVGLREEYKAHLDKRALCASQHRRGMYRHAGMQRHTRLHHGRVESVVCPREFRLVRSFSRHLSDAWQIARFADGRSHCSCSCFGIRERNRVIERFATEGGECGTLAYGAYAIPKQAAQAGGCRMSNAS